MNPRADRVRADPEGRPGTRNDVLLEHDAPEVIRAEAERDLTHRRPLRHPRRSDVLDATYGPPEYGGNRNLVGWTVNHWDGDTQPRGFTPDRVSNPDPSPTTPPLTPQAAVDALKKFLPGMAGQAAARSTPWRSRPGYERG